LVAYIVPEQGNRGIESELRTQLRRRLPDYMVPGAFVELAALPLTSNGKLDRKALPRPEEDKSGAELIGLRTPVEELVAGMWGEVRRRKRVGAEENFFELGGRSLLATQVVSRIRQVFGVELPLRSLFEQPTVAGLARELEQWKRSGRAITALPIV